MTRPRGRRARQVALAASDRRRVALTHHEAHVDVERRVLPHQDVARLDNGPLNRAPRPGRARRRRGAAEQPPTPLPIPAEPDIPLDADRVGAAESDLAGTAAEMWADVIAAAAGEPLERGKTRKEIDRTLRGKGALLKRVWVG